MTIYHFVIFLVPGTHFLDSVKKVREYQKGEIKQLDFNHS
jgi:hypothetical protein